MTSRRGSPQQAAADLKEQLIRKVMEFRLAREADGARRTAPAAGGFAAHPAWRRIELMREGAARLGLSDPYFRVHEGIAGATIGLGGARALNFSSYNYLGLSGDPRVNEAASAAIARHGTSVSASRLVAGERGLHGALEQALAEALGVEACIAFVSGHATNVSTIASLFGPADLVVHDALAHNSILQGIALAGAQRLPFPHNDAAALDRLLAEQRHRFERVLVVLEGVYSMDGDIPDLPAFIEVKRRHDAFLMVDEAHSFGVLGAGGLGIREHFGLAGSDVDVWMGTLSKTLAGCGGFVAGGRPMVEILRYNAPGFVYSVGMSPPLAAASLKALEIMRSEPWRVARLQDNGRRFLEAARAAGVDTGLSQGHAVVPAITGSSIRSVRLSQALLERGVVVAPIVHPAVAEQSSRLRFFVSCEHTDAQIDTCVEALAQGLHAA